LVVLVVVIVFVGIFLLMELVGVVGRKNNPTHPFGLSGLLSGINPDPFHNHPKHNPKQG